jgi:DNA repair photolyase
VVRPVSNPPNPWETIHAEWLGEPPPAELEVFEEEAKSILSENDSPDIGFRFSVNPYRGCFHSCGYCYARPTHQYLGWGAGTDFDRKIVAKVNAPVLLRAEMSKRSWKGDTIVFSGITDCYQPIEATYSLTRRCLEVCADFRNPIGIVTKGALIRRDVDLLARLAEEADCGVWISTPFADDATGRVVEPGASPPSQRFETMRILARAGVRVGVAVAPVIPGLNDSHIAEILQRARDAGARHAFIQPVRLPAEVLPVFEQRIAESFPQRTNKIWSAIQEMRGGKKNESRFGARMTGLGPRWAAIKTLFAVECKRLGLNEEDPERHHATTFRRPSAQGSLFDR